MGKETSKALARRQREGYFAKYFIGRGLDIGCGEDPLPLCDKWDLPQGDATYLSGVPNESYDFVYSSHCLEHLDDPDAAVLNWWRVLKPGGHLIIAVPDEDLYEQGFWPSRFAGAGHKTTWHSSKWKTWSPVSRSMTSLIRLLPEHKLISLRIIDDGYDHNIKGVDQSAGNAEVIVEAIIKKGDLWVP